MNQTDYISINKLALALDVSVTRIKAWYKWMEDDNFSKPEGLMLPPYYYMDSRRTKFFKKSDVPKIKEFHKKINGSFKGAMAEYNALYSWGNRGKKILKKKGE